MNYNSLQKNFVLYSYQFSTKMSADMNLQRVELHINIRLE